MKIIPYSKADFNHFFLTLFHTKKFTQAHVNTNLIVLSTESSNREIDVVNKKKMLFGADILKADSIQHKKNKPWR